MCTNSTGANEGIKQQIESIRDRMIELGKVYGLGHPQVLSASRELDALILHYYKSKLKS